MAVITHGPYPVLVDRKLPLIRLAIRAGFDSLEQDKSAKLTAIGRESLGSVTYARLRFLKSDCKITTDEVLTEMSNRYLAPASLTELLSLAIPGPDKIRTFRECYPIITLGTKWQEKDSSLMLTGFVTGGPRWNEILLVDFTSEWLAGSQFLAREQ